MRGSNTNSLGYVDPNFPNPDGPQDVPIIIYGYTPSFAFAVAAAVLFALSLALHAWQVARYRTWYFVTVPIGLGFEIVGYIARSLSAHVDPYNLIFFVLNYFFIVTAPVLLSAGIYAVLSVLINRLGREHSPVASRAVLACFITSDVVATITQVTGAALIGVKESKRQDPTVANDILLGGLAFQVFSLGLFCLLAGVFLVRVRAMLVERRMQAFIAAFVAVTLLVYLRTCFRLAETAQGLMQNLSSHEVYFATLEFMPIALAVLIFNIWHPGRCCVSPVKVDK